MERETVGLIGLGRFGGMVYRYLRETKSLQVFDSDPDRLRDIPEAAPLEQVASSSRIILCVPISAMEEVCSQIAPLLKEGQTVADTCSVKGNPVKWMLAHLPPGVQILGTHPLFGPDSGSAGISGLKIALSPVRIEPRNYRRICACLTALGLKIVETTPDEHDRQIAKSQAVFHLIAQAMKGLDWATQPITTPGPEAFYRLVESVQHDTPELFRDLERENPYAVVWRRRFIEELSRMDEELSDPEGAPPPGDGPGEPG